MLLVHFGEAYLLASRRDQRVKQVERASPRRGFVRARTVVRARAVMCARESAVSGSFSATLALSVRDIEWLTTCFGGEGSCPTRCRSGR
jgi:hypothetical protein